MAKRVRFSRRRRAPGARRFRRYRRRFINRRRRAGYSRTLGLRGNRGFPPVLRMKDFYGNQGLAADAAPGKVWVKTYRGNSIYDPDEGGVGTSSLFYSEMSAIYNKYRVMGMKLIVRAQNLSDDPIYAKVAMATSTADVEDVVYDPIVYKTIPNCVVKLMGPKGSSNDRTVIKMFRKTKAMFNVKNVRDEEDYCGVVGANPVLQWFGGLQLMQTNAANALDVWYEIKVVYYVEWFDRIIADYDVVGNNPDGPVPSA